jgi:hypothetical protein
MIFLWPWTIRAIEGEQACFFVKIRLPVAAEAQFTDRLPRSHSNLKKWKLFMYRFHTQWGVPKQRGRMHFGDLRSIHSVFSYFNCGTPPTFGITPLPAAEALIDIGATTFPFTLSFRR